MKYKVKYQIVSFIETRINNDIVISFEVPGESYYKLTSLFDTIDEALEAVYNINKYAYYTIMPVYSFDY